MLLNFELLVYFVAVLVYYPIDPLCQLDKHGSLFTVVNCSTACHMHCIYEGGSISKVPSSLMGAHISYWKWPELLSKSVVLMHNNVHLHMAAWLGTAFSMGGIGTSTLHPGLCTQWFPSLRTVEEAPGRSTFQNQWQSSASRSTTLQLIYSMLVTIRWCANGANSLTTMVTLWRNNMYQCLTMLRISLNS